MYAVYFIWKQHESDGSFLMVQISTKMETANECVKWIYSNFDFITQLRDVDENNPPVELKIMQVAEIINHNYHDN